MVDVIETDENGLNARIQFHLLPAGKMAEFGFRDCGDQWYLMRFVGPKYQDRYDVSFNVSIPKDGSRGRIDVLDENFCQPYDYNLVLSRNPDNRYARTVRDDVERETAVLADAGIISGHEYGEYI
jgi:hypothetical protein